MFDRITDRARRVIVLSAEEARGFNHHYIGTEHLLLGTIREHDGVAANALASMNVSFDEAHSLVESIIGRGGEAPEGHIPFTPRARRVLEHSLRESIDLGHTNVGTEHILLGLIDESDGVAAQVLRKLGADPAFVRDRVLDILAGGAGPWREQRRTVPERHEETAPGLDDPELDERVRQIRDLKAWAIDRQDYEVARMLREIERLLRQPKTDDGS